MKKLHTVILLIIFTGIATVFASVVINLQVQSQGDNASLSWSVSGISLTGQQKFIVLRKTPQTDYLEIGEITASSNNYSYQYNDKAAYKTSDVIYTYKIRLVDNSGYVYGSSSDQGIYLNISGVKKTWGSIKAMFR